MGICASGNKEDLKDKSSNSTTLTPADIELVKSSWRLVVKGGLREYGSNMMMRIFLEHKELKPLWRFAKNLETADQMNSSQALKAHGEKLFNAIDMAVNSLDDLPTLAPILVHLGAIHQKYGVKDEHFGVIGEMLISTLKDGLKEDFTDKVMNAWLKVFNVVQIQMKLGMKEAATQQQQQQHVISADSNESNNSPSMPHAHVNGTDSTTTTTNANGKVNVSELEQINLQTAAAN